MPGCSALNCSNTEKNSRLFKFPKDENRRKVWTEMCDRPNWVPKPASKLCQVHFTEDQFEQNREDGWKKLKCNAVPTLFYHTKDTQTESNLDRQSISDMLEDVKPVFLEDIIDVETIRVPEDHANATKSAVDVDIEVRQFEETLEKYQRQLWRANKEIQKLKEINQILEEQIQKSPFLNEALKSSSAYKITTAIASDHLQTFK